MFLRGPRLTSSGTWAFAADVATFPFCSPSTAAGELKKRGAPSAGRLVLTCTLETRADYTTAAVARFQKEPVKPNETRRNSESKSRKRKR